MIRQASFILRLAAQDLKGNAAVHLVAGAIISAAFLTLGVFILVAINLGALSRYWEKKIQVCVYLKDGLADSDRQAMLMRLHSLDGIERVDYLSKQEALAEFKGMLGHDAGLLEGLDDNPLPASFTLSLDQQARDLERIKKLSAEIGSWPGVEQVDYGGTVLESFESISRLAQGAVTLVAGLILVAVVFIISNTVRLTMYSRSEEIGIMKLVGASNLLIRAPFVIEGMLQGMAAALVGIGALRLMYWALLRGLDWPAALTGFSPAFLTPAAAWALVAGGALLGAAGSLSKVRDFMRV